MTTAQEGIVAETDPRSDAVFDQESAGPICSSPTQRGDDMTRRAFQLWVAVIASMYALMILTGFVLNKWTHYYDIFKDLLPLGTALPAAMLAGAYQRRSSFLQQLRSSWTSLIDSIQEAVQFTHLTEPDSAAFAKLMKTLSVVIDDFRSLYKNLGEGKESRGYYPFESLKQIKDVISAYYLTKDYSDEKQDETRRRVILLWKQVRDPVLEEFDRPAPTYFDSPFAKGRVAVPREAAIEARR